MRLRRYLDPVSRQRWCCLCWSTPSYSRRASTPSIALSCVGRKAARLNRRKILVARWRRRNLRSANRMEEYLPLIWAAIIGLAVAMYVILDGFDLGIGVLFPFARDDQDRD